MMQKHMADYKEYFKDKKVTLMRIGLLGRGVGDASFLAEAGAEVLVVDDAPQEIMQPSVDALKDYKSIQFKFGPYDLADFTNTDMVLKGAGTPIDSPEIEAARKSNVPVEMSASLFAKLSGIPIIGITGTRGKSTITHMVYHVLTQGTEGGNVILGGNVRGISNLQLLKDVEEDSIAVMELDSWQLQGFGESQISPQIAVFSNFMEDHLNYYHNDMDLYFGDKAHIFIHQEDSGVFITIPEVFERAKEFAKGKVVTLGQELILVDESALPEDFLISMPGKHNRLNAALALEALKATSLPEELILEGLTTFPGVPGRLEYVKEIQNVKIYNDNNSTTPQATLAGLEALSEEKNIVLIMGGADKGIDMNTLLTAIPKYCKKVILLPGTGTDRLLSDLEESDTYSTINRSIFEKVNSLEESVKKAFLESENGDTILFSPAFASFGLFKNEYERNDLFMDLIMKT